MQKNQIINEDMLLDGQVYLDKKLEDPAFKEAFEVEMLRLKDAQLLREKQKNVVKEALEVEKIKQAQNEANNGDFATNDEVAALLKELEVHAN
jgi:hypothetical protein